MCLSIYSCLLLSFSGVFKKFPLVGSCTFPVNFIPKCLIFLVAIVNYFFNASIMSSNLLLFVNMRATDIAF